MNTQKYFRRVLGIIALVFLTLSLTVSNSAAQVAGLVSKVASPLTQGPIPVVNRPEGGGPVPGGPGFVILNGFDFMPYYQTSNYVFSGTLLINNGTMLAFYIAPLHLPQGATINQMVAYYLDQDAGEGIDISIDLLRCDVFLNGCDTIAEIVSIGTTAGFTYAIDPSIDYPIVDNSMYSYAVQVEMPASMAIGINAVRIDYTYSVSLPAVVR